ncbi:MAG TPA: putative quinol monooxygenase [Deltaproteobacteria bacterium]|nr:putative quinol monooxygenase [Deltaproteobacteria bacterium]HOM28875.1 putative quinol monooxygenase [Deltaproteobacteria bacterium]HPP81505.1 putative quinol monooxygenase [Deltaproteobacteria bacterium]
MITVIATMRAKKGAEAEVEDALREMTGKVAGEEGTLEYVLHRSVKDPCLFVMYERYRDKDALASHSSSPHFLKLLERIGPAIDGQPSIEILGEIARAHRTAT